MRSSNLAAITLKTNSAIGIVSAIASWQEKRQDATVEHPAKTTAVAAGSLTASGDTQRY